jgi:ABC-type transport system involved in cytochrome c biogenesis permease subunit
MTARIFEWNAFRKHRRGLQPGSLERTANPTATIDPVDVRSLAQAPRHVVMRAMATALIAFWSAVAALVLSWWRPL